MYPPAKTSIGVATRINIAPKTPRNTTHFLTIAAPLISLTSEHNSYISMPINAKGCHIGANNARNFIDGGTSGPLPKGRPVYSLSLGHAKKDTRF
jgi:hypothetical protein